jgi:predicted outer membrane protein
LTSVLLGAERVLARFDVEFDASLMKESPMRFMLGSLGVLAVLLVAQPSTAQEQQDRLREQREAQTEQRQIQGQQRQGQQRGSAEAGQVEEKLAAELALGNHLEAQLGQFATQQASAQEVREFAQRMTQEHTQFITQLRQFMPTVGQDLIQEETAERADQTRRPDQPQRERTDAAAQPPRRTTEREASGGQGLAGHDPILQIHKKAGQRKLQLTRDLLEQKQGREFDTCYMGGQVVAHIGMLAKLEAMQGVGSPEFQQLVSQGARATEDHLQMAQQILRTLESQGPGERVTRRPGQQQQQQQQQPE